MLLIEGPQSQLYSFLLRLGMFLFVIAPSFLVSRVVHAVKRICLYCTRSWRTGTLESKTTLWYHWYCWYRCKFVWAKALKQQKKTRLLWYVTETVPWRFYIVPTKLMFQCVWCLASPSILLSFSLSRWCGQYHVPYTVCTWVNMFPALFAWTVLRHFFVFLVFTELRNTFSRSFSLFILFPF